ncbi:DUF7344 domain-containing protein [Haloarcula rubra]|uniref:DUF7344 domain-containing protein n=1 Tax=Haloarcula rubra TaxID=2487747 RepID=UPI003CCC0BD5
MTVAEQREIQSVLVCPGERTRYQTHLPRLECADVVVYDQERELVSLPKYSVDAAPNTKWLMNG